MVEEVSNAVGESVKKLILAALPDDAEGMRVANIVKGTPPRFLSFIKPQLDSVLTEEGRKKIVSKVCDSVAYGFCHERLAYVMATWAGIPSVENDSCNFVKHLVGLAD